jgi:Arc/MetJ-type ribon-helix-helix transcriptional regulator
LADRAISVRLDEPAQAALRVLTSGGASRSAAIRDALVEWAARQHSTLLAAEAAAIAADEGDRREIAEVLALMESLDAER